LIRPFYVGKGNSAAPPSSCLLLTSFRSDQQQKVFCSIIGLTFAFSIFFSHPPRFCIATAFRAGVAISWPFLPNPTEAIRRGPRRGPYGTLQRGLVLGCAAAHTVIRIPCLLARLRTTIRRAYPTRASHIVRSCFRIPGVVKLPVNKTPNLQQCPLNTIVNAHGGTDVSLEQINAGWGAK
jgi:hypothetical protein